MTSWEYCQVTIDSLNNSATYTRFQADGAHEIQEVRSYQANTIIAQLGLDGWEMVGTAGRPHLVTYVFKRRLPQPA